MQKTYVLDTNVLLHSPQALFSFQDNKIVIPEVVLEELDRFKKDTGELGANARQVTRILDALRERGKLNEGVYLDNGGFLKVELNHRLIYLPESWDRKTADNRILQVCKGLSDQGEQVFLVTKDMLQRIKADVINVVAQDFMREQAPVKDEQYCGRLDVYISSEKMNAFYSKRDSLDVQDTLVFDQVSQKYAQPDFTRNQFVLLRSLEAPRQTSLAYYNGSEIVPLRFLSHRPFGISPKTAGQRFLQEALYLDPDKAPLVIVKGPAGTGKTFYSLAVGLDMIMNNTPKAYRKVMFCRPNVTMDEEIGFLPGNEQEKLTPMLRGVRDNLEILLDSDEQHRYDCEKGLNDKIDEIFYRNIICTEAVAYLRGRSITRQWVILDEAQNLTPRQVKAIITRIGQGTKLILMGDPDQIDHPFLDARTNGLSYASEKMKGSEFCFQITLTEDECERSPLAADGARRM